MYKMKEVIVLTDNETHKSELLHGSDFGTIDHSKWLCVKREPDVEKIFTFQTLGLDIEDKKMGEFMHIKDGIVIIVNESKLNVRILNKIQTIVQNNKHIPIMFYLEDDCAYTHTFVHLHRLSGLHKNEIVHKSQNNDLKTLLLSIINLSSKFENFNWFLNIYEANTWFNAEIKKDNLHKVKAKLTSVDINVHLMAEQFQNVTLPLHMWDHYGRLRIVDYSLAKYGYNHTIDPNGWLCKHWKLYKTTIGHGELWHYSLTRFWIDILYDLQKKNNYKTFYELYTSNVHIQNGGLFKKYYSNDVIFSSKARNEWIPPNLILSH